MTRLSTVTLAELDGLPCPYCGRGIARDTPWAVSAATLYGWCGAKLMVDDVTVGALLLGPTDEPGQAMLTSLWVRPGWTGNGCGRQLVQAVAAGLVDQKVHVLLAQGSRRTLRCSAPPRDFLREVGFTRGLEERVWRMDLDRTVTGERNGVLGVFERFFDSLRPVSPPKPAGGAISGRVHRS